MTEAVYYRLELVALVGLVLSVPTILLQVRRDISIGFEYYYSGRDMLEWERGREFPSLRKTCPITEMGFPCSIAPFPSPAKYAYWNGGNGARL